MPAAAIIAMVAACAAAFAGTGWPLRDGGFSGDMTGHVERPDWVLSLQSGRHALEFEALQSGPYPPRTAVIRSEVTGRAVLFQDLPLPAGDYTFVVGARTTPHALVVLNVAGADRSYTGEEWAEVAVDFSVAQHQSVRLHILSVRTGEVRLRDARLDVRRLESGMVPLEDGRWLGALVIPPDATEAEQYAAWELQQFIRRMTGLTPGLEGRDETGEGVRIRVGRAVGEEKLALLQGRPQDSYLVAALGDDILLAGNNDRGTLYAVYDFLRQQGCGWYTPGPLGEVVPQRSLLRTVQGERVEAPDWDVRGLMKHGCDWDPSDVWRQWNTGDYLDWTVRNRLNAFWGSYALTLDFGAWRGGSHIIRTNHSWASFWMQDGQAVKPEWAPLVAGERKPLHVSRRPNLPCTSNPEFRDRTVERILEFFRENPQAVVYGVSADDEPADWCECPQCRAQDPDGGAEPWRTDERGMPLISMTDRSLNYVNEVAGRVAQVFPDRIIEMYAYASTRQPPARERVEPNVLIKYCLWPGAVPFGISARDRTFPRVAELSRILDGWRQAGAQHLGLYDYGNYRYGDVPQLWLRHIADSKLTLHETWGFRHYLGENSNTFAPSHMAYNLRARVLWSRTTDYRAAIREVCDGYYGPGAQAMYDYYVHMDEAYLDYWRENADLFRRDDPPPYAALELQEFSFETMAEGQRLLDGAWEAVAEDAALRARLAPVRFGHALATYTMAMTAERAQRRLTRREVEQARGAWELARALREDHRIMVARATTGHLSAFRVAPPVQDVVFELPIESRFRRDPENRGLEEHWYRADVDDSWVDIRTDAAWTQQGHEYHGVAWYAVEFTLNEAARALLDRAAQQAPALGFDRPVPVLFFGAVDGYADIFLDGVKIGEQKEPPGVMWDQPFTIPLPADFAPHETHRLVVRVEKDSHAAGIWRPVRIVLHDP